MPADLSDASTPGRTPQTAVWQQVLRGLTRVSWRLALGFGALLLLMLVSLALAMTQIRAMSDLTQGFGTQDLPRLMEVQTLSVYTEGAGNALLRLMNAPRDQRVAEYAEVDERNRRIDRLVQSLHTRFDDPAQEKTLSRLVAARARYADAFIAMADEVEADDLGLARRVYAEQVRPALQDLLSHSNELMRREREHIEWRLAQARDQSSRIFFGLVGLGVIAMLFALLLAWRTTRSVVTPLTALEASALRIAQGDYSSPTGTLGSEEVARVQQALTTMTAAIAAREQDIERLAYVDALTGLPNRTYLLRPPASVRLMPFNCLVLFDLARLKTMNETLGYATGDQLIREVATRATAVLAQAHPPASGVMAPAVLTHLSAGRFALALSRSSRSDAEHLCRKLEAAMRTPVDCSGQSVDLSLVFGLSEVPDAMATGAPLTLLRNAEIALQSAKRSAQTFAWYSEAQEAARLSHLNLLSELRSATDCHHLQMWLQPKFALADGHAVGLEALVRWQHPTRGFIQPGEFVPFAEQTGAIKQITHWMLGQAVRTLADWTRTHPQLSIAVNISTHDLQDDSLLEQARRLLAQHDVAPQRLRLEIVETGLMQDPEHSVAMLQALRSLGVHLSIDDFGTGYSSLAYLRRLPVTELKIDRSFISGLDHQLVNQRLVHTMVELGHGMGLSVTAEGVETEAEKQALMALGCDVMQGYLVSRPLHGEPLQTWLQALGRS
jgi:EAL domain-containing protein (putative c-di-GMP-specific phosphodiesterase class I)/GGDEF domain-containing protein